MQLTSGVAADGVVFAVVRNAVVVSVLMLVIWNRWFLMSFKVEKYQRDHVSKWRNVES
jgi:hypothetical protein